MSEYSIERQAWKEESFKKETINKKWDEKMERKARAFVSGFSPKIQEAFEIANRIHKNERRKLTYAPYMVHPFGVFKTLTQYTDDEDTLCGALLHDTIENDENYSVEKLQKDIGTRVAEIVEGVSENRNKNEQRTKQMTWKERKLGYLEKIETDPEPQLMICAADKIDNLKSIIVGYKKWGESVWKNFNASEGDMMWFYEEVFRILTRRLRNPIIKELKKRIKEIQTLRAARRN